jgi:site-specific recombinase XerD
MDTTIQTAMDGYLASVEFALDLKERGYAKRTVQLYLTAVQGLYGYLLDLGVPLDVERLKRAYKKARDIRGEERPKDPKLAIVRAIVRAARSVPGTPGHEPGQRKRALCRLRNIALVETLRATGCRIGEAVSLRVGDISAGGRSALVRGKGRKYRHVYWDDVSWDAVLAYLRARGIQPGDEGKPLFSGHGNRAGKTPGALSVRHADRIVHDLAHRAGVTPEEEATPHYFRHVFATLALDKTDNLAVVQDLLGHESPVTTRVYARTDERQRQAVHASVWAE